MQDALKVFSSGMLQKGPILVGMGCLDGQVAAQSFISRSCEEHYDHTTVVSKE
jgi:hypothetical protein